MAAMSVPARVRAADRCRLYHIGAIPLLLWAQEASSGSPGGGEGGFAEPLDAEASATATWSTSLPLAPREPAAEG